jgi:uncharacterized protein YndB with AHSA1/START domain
MTGSRLSNEGWQTTHIGGVTGMAAKTRGYAHRVEIRCSAARVWQGLIEPAAVSLWHGKPASIRPRPGGFYDAVLAPGHERQASIDVFEPQRRLRLVYQPPPQLPAFNGAVVDDYLLDPGTDGTVLRLLASGFPESPSWDAHYLQLRKASQRAVLRLKVLLERPAAIAPAGPPGSLPPG